MRNVCIRSMYTKISGKKKSSSRVYAKPFHVLRFTVSKPRKVSTKKKCMRKNRDFRFTAHMQSKHILALNFTDIIKNIE